MNLNAFTTEVVLPVKTDAGTFLARYSDRGLATLEFPPRGPATRPLSADPSDSQWRWHQQTIEAVRLRLAGMEVKELPPLDLQAHTDFQRAVWNVLLRIPPGKTLTYGEVAEAVGCPQGSQAAGQACGRNPIPVIIPCHRVLAASGKIGGFSGGLEWKLDLLKRERVLL